MSDGTELKKIQAFMKRSDSPVDITEGSLSYGHNMSDGAMLGRNGDDGYIGMLHVPQGALDRLGFMEEDNDVEYVLILRKKGGNKGGDQP